MAYKILCIDDDQVNIKILQKRLEEKGYEVMLAIDGEAGLQRAKEAKPDLIILDVEMPKMDGYQFMMQRNKLKELVVTPVIVLTAHEEMQPIFKLKGVKDYLVKPINFDQLFEKLVLYLPPRT
jgi:CheY-like chemotaxis protein